MRSLASLLTLTVLVLGTGCSDRSEPGDRPTATADSNEAVEESAGSGGTDEPDRSLLDDRVGVWEPDAQGERVQFAAPVATQDLDSLVQAFNDRFDDPFYPTLLLLGVDGAVARVGVSDDAQFGEQMGTTGAELYAASVVLTLTSHPEIDSVYFDVEEGSHAGPGVASRASVADVAGR